MCSSSIHIYHSTIPARPNIEFTYSTFTIINNLFRINERIYLHLSSMSIEQSLLFLPLFFMIDGMLCCNIVNSSETLEVPNNHSTVLIYSIKRLLSSSSFFFFALLREPLPKEEGDSRRQQSYLEWYPLVGGLASYH